MIIKKNIYIQYFLLINVNKLILRMCRLKYLDELI